VILQAGFWGCSVANRKASKGLYFMVTDEEYNQLRMQADNIGSSVNKFVKRRVLGLPVVAPVMPFAVAVLCNADIKRVGNNLNQIAHRLNSGDSVAQGELAACKQELAEIRALWQL
jgi:hypothetical protein